MKAIMLSIKPEYCELIASGEKTIEVRKTRPNLKTPFKCYIYCTASDVHSCLVVGGRTAKAIPCCNYKTAFIAGGVLGNGKVIGEFVCDRIDIIDDYTVGMGKDEYYLICGGVLDGTCLTGKEIYDYGKGKTLYGLHITDLVIYDKPKELWDFKYPCPKRFDNYDCSWGFKECKYKVPDRVPYECDAALSRPPQSWCYVECWGWDVEG